MEELLKGQNFSKGFIDFIMNIVKDYDSEFGDGSFFKDFSEEYLNKVDIKLTGKEKLLFILGTAIGSYIY